MSGVGAADGRTPAGAAEGVAVSAAAVAAGSDAATRAAKDAAGAAGPLVGAGAMTAAGGVSEEGAGAWAGGTSVIGAPGVTAGGAVSAGGTGAGSEGGTGAGSEGNGAMGVAGSTGAGCVGAVSAGGAVDGAGSTTAVRGSGITGSSAWAAAAVPMITPETVRTRSPLKADLIKRPRRFNKCAPPRCDIRFGGRGLSAIPDVAVGSATKYTLLVVYSMVVPRLAKVLDASGRRRPEAPPRRDRLKECTSSAPRVPSVRS